MKVRCNIIFAWCSMHLIKKWYGDVSLRDAVKNHLCTIQTLNTFIFLQLPKKLFKYFLKTYLFLLETECNALTSGWDMKSAWSDSRVIDDRTTLYVLCWYRSGNTKKIEIWSLCYSTPDTTEYLSTYFYHKQKCKQTIE